MESHELITRWLTENTSLSPQVLQQAVERAKASGESVSDLLLHHGLLSQEHYDLLAAGAASSSSSPSSGSLPIFLGYEGIDRYDIIEELAQGGMGKVYLARVKATGITVVIKTLIKVKNSSKQVERFHREGMALARLSHPNIARVYDFRLSNTDSNEHCYPYLVMEHIAGQTLGHYFEDRHRKGAPLDPKHLKIVFVPLAKALIHCHENGIIHRDVKPENILVDSSLPSGSPPRPVLIDFGLVQVDKENVRRSLELSQQLTQSGQLLGSPAFAAPEQLHGEIEKFGAALDVWGFGATLYWAASGQLPYDARSLYELFSASDNDDPKPLRSHNPAVPLWLDHLCARCLQREPTLRPSLDEVLELFESESFSSPNQFHRRLIFVGVILCSLLIVAVLFFNRDQQAPTLELKIGDPVTQKSVFQLKGQIVDNAPAHIWLRGKNPKKKKKRYPVNDDGRFQIAIDLEEGQNTFVISAEDESGNFSTSQNLSLVKDTNAPTILSLTYPKLTYEKQVKLTGQVNESGILHLSGRAFHLTQDLFSATVDLSVGRNKVNLRVVDAAGNESQKNIEIIRRAVFHVVPTDRLKDYDNSFDSFAKAVAKAPPRSRIQVYPGIYDCGLAIEKCLEIRGVGERSKVVLRSENKPFAIRAADVELSNLTIQNVGTRNHSDALQLFGNDSQVRNCDIYSKNRQGINIGYDTQISAKRIHIEGCNFRNSGQSGMIANLKSTVTISNCRFERNNSYGLFVRHQAKVKVAACQFEKNHVGMKAELKAQVTVKDCAFISNRHEGLVVETNCIVTVNRCQIIGNGFVSEGYKLSNIYVAYSCKVALTDCLIKGSANDGICARELSELRLNNCVIKDSGGFGVSAHGNTNFYLQNCELKNNSFGVKLERKGGKIKIQ